MKFRVVMHEVKPPPDENPFRIGLINETGRRREAVIDADSEQEVRDFFKDAQDRDFETVRGFELTHVHEVPGKG